jgi:hypothetical protein
MSAVQKKNQQSQQASGLRKNGNLLHKFDKPVLVTILNWRSFGLVLLPLPVLEQFWKLAVCSEQVRSKNTKIRNETQSDCFIVLEKQIRPV